MEPILSLPDPMEEEGNRLLIEESSSSEDEESNQLQLEMLQDLFPDTPTPPELNHHNTVEEGTHPDMIGVTDEMFEDDRSTVDDRCQSTPDFHNGSFTLSQVMEPAVVHCLNPTLDHIRFVTVPYQRETLTNQLLTIKIMGNKSWIIDFIIQGIPGDFEYHKVFKILKLHDHELLDQQLITISDGHHYFQYKPCNRFPILDNMEWSTLNPNLSILLLK